MRQEQKRRKAAGVSPSDGATRRERKIHLRPAHAIDAFKPVAALITSDAPDWLAEHLRQWSPTIYLSDAVELRQPTRAEMLNILTHVRNAAGLLQRALAEPSVCEFLDAGGSDPLDSPAKFQMILGELLIRADRASKLPSLVDARGRAKPGRRHALPDGAIPTQTYYALLIAEAWKWFRGKYPAPGNSKATQAIELYWELCGCERDRWGGQPRTAWRYHFITAASMPAEKERAEFRRHMRECSRYADSLKPNAALEGGN